MIPSGGEPPLRLLALDGGGIRGLSELLIIKKVMHRLMVKENKQRKKDGLSFLSDLPKPCEYFDLIGGTSTGGIIALMLGHLRMDVNTAIEHYDALSGVFSDPKQWGEGRFKTSKLEDAIKSLVKDTTGNSESPLMESDEAGVCRTFVCAMNAHNMNATIPMLFRTYHSRETHPNCKIWEAARATSAAPTFFKRIEIGGTQKQPFIDGGLGCNNPSRLVLDEAKHLFGSRQLGLLLSVGSGMAKVTSFKKLGIFQRIVRTEVIDALKAIATDSEVTHEAMVDLFANFPNTYIRLNVEQGMQEVNFAEWEKLGNVEAHTTHYMNRKEVDAKLSLLVNVIVAPRGEITIEHLVSPRPLVESLSIHVKDRKLCPLPVASFIGRNEILQKMHKYFDSDGEFQRVFVLYGLGGSGKSQLAFKFLQESQANQRFSDVFYIDATNKKTLEMDLEAITLGDAEQSVDASLRWLANNTKRRWILVFDNADDVHLDLNTFFPSCTSGNILVTTRNRELRHYAGKGSDQNVTGMEHDDATNLLLHLSRADETDGNKELAAQIVQELHHFALAVSQAGAFIHCHSSLSRYLQLYRRERDNLLQHEEPQGRDPYRLAVYATWSLSYEKLDESARSFLQICSMLHHEGISEEMFEKAALSQYQLEDSEMQNDVARLLNLLGKRDSGWSSWDFLQVVKRLGSYSLIECDNRNCTYSLHPLVQHWSGTTMGKRGHVMRKCVTSIIGLSISWAFNQEDYKYRRALLKHITNSATSLNPPEIDTLVASCLALTYSESGRWKDAEMLQAMVMEKRKRLQGDNDLDTLTSMANLANTYKDQGRWKDAEGLQLVVMEKRKWLLGDDHLQTLTSMANLANTYWNQGRWKDAESLQLVVMDERKRLLGADHPHTLKTMGNLANTYAYQGRWKEAEVLQLLVMEKRKQLLGDDHPDTLTSMANLANLYRDQGRWKDAELLRVVVMEKTKQLLGDDHPETLTSMGSLANTYRNQGRWKDAEVLEIVVMERTKQLLGDDHPDTLRSMGNLATTYRNQGRWKDAEVLEVVVVERTKRLLGDDHPETLTSMGSLAHTYRNQGRWKDAEVLEVVVMEKMKRLLGDYHPETLTSMGNLANTYRNQGQWKDAEKLEVVVMEKTKQLLGDDHPETLTSMGNLAITFVNQGRWTDAVVLQVVVMEKRKRLLGDDHPHTLKTMGNLAHTYRKQGRWKDAEVLEVVMMEKRKQLLGNDHPETVTSMANLANTYWNQGRWKDAEVLQVLVVEKRKQLLGDDHLHTVTSMANLAHMYGRQGCWKDAEVLEVVVMEKRKRLLGDDHPHTLASMANLAIAYRKQGRWRDAELLETLS